MVKFAAPQHTQGPLAGYAVTGRWVSVKRDPQWRGEPGYEEYEFAHHYEPVTGSRPMDPVIAMSMALHAWRDESNRCDPSHSAWRPPDSVTVDAVYASQLSPSADSQDDDPFRGLEGQR